LDSAFGTILRIAIGIGPPEVVRWLLERGVDPNTKSAGEESSCLNRAIGKKNIELVRLLLDYGAALDTTNTIVNPLYSAIYYGNFESAKLLIDRGLDVNVQYNAKPPHTNALLFAKTWGRSDIVKLIESKLPPASTDVSNIATNVAKQAARPRSKRVIVDKSHDWSLHYVFDGDKPLRFREFRIAGNALWTTQGKVSTFGRTQRSDFDSPAEAARAYEQACEQASSDGFEIDRSGIAENVAKDRTALTDEIYRGAKLAFEETRRNHPDAPPAMFGLQSDSDAMLVISVSNPRIDIDSVVEIEMERVWILNLWEYDEGSEYLDPAYRVMLLPRHDEPLAGGGLSHEEAFDCFIDALARMRKEGFFGSEEEGSIVLFQVLDSLEHVEQNKLLNSPEIFRKYRTWVNGE
jgi:predicted DNA-binding WGR domain protein